MLAPVHLTLMLHRNVLAQRCDVGRRVEALVAFVRLGNGGIGLEGLVAWSTAPRRRRQRLAVAAGRNLRPVMLSVVVRQTGPRCC